MNYGTQAGRQTHDRRRRLSPVSAVCFAPRPGLAPPVEVLVRVRVKAYPGPHEDRDLNTGRDMSEVPIGKEEKKHQEKKTTQEVTTFTCDNIKRKQYIQT